MNREPLAGNGNAQMASGMFTTTTAGRRWNGSYRPYSRALLEVQMGDFEKFADALDALIRRWQQEADLSYAEAVGALAFKQHELMHEVKGDEQNVPN